MSPSRPVRWVEISPQPQRERYQSLSEALKEAGRPNEVEFLQPSEGDLLETVLAAKAEFDQIRIGGAFQSQLPLQLDHSSSQMLTLRCADAMVPETGGWWPRNFLSEAVQMVLAQELKDLDFGGDVLMIGATPECRSVVAALVRAGFERFNLADPNDRQAQDLATEFRRSYFTAKFGTTPQHLLTQLPGVHSIVVNCFPVLENPQILTELYFFNFLKTGGTVMDLSPVPVDSPLLKEAKVVGGQIVTGPRLAAWTDALWIRSCFGLDFAVDEWQGKLEERLAQIPIDIVFPVPDAAEVEIDEEPKTGL